MVFLVLNRKSEHHHWILHIRISLRTNYQLKQFWFFGPSLPKNCIQKRKKSEDHHWLLHIWIRLRTKFQLKEAFLVFWTKFPRKGYFRLETERSHLRVSLSSFHTGADRHNGILMSLLILVAETKKVFSKLHWK